MPSYVDVQDAATVMADDEKAVEHVEGKRWYREEVHRGNRLTVIVQKGQPALRRLRTFGCPSHPAGDGGFRYLEAEHEKFAMDAGRTPTWILCDHLED